MGCSLTHRPEGRVVHSIRPTQLLDIHFVGVVLRRRGTTDFLSIPHGFLVGRGYQNTILKVHITNTHLTTLQTTGWQSSVIKIDNKTHL